MYSPIGDQKFGYSFVYLQDRIPSLHQSEDYSAWALGKIQKYSEMIQLEIIHKPFKQGTYGAQISE